MKLSVIVPVFNESLSLLPSIEVVVSYLDALPLSWDLLLVDDGSVDDTWLVVCQLSRQENIEGIRFSRNFGKEAAILAGLESVDGNYVLVMDSDLQHPPELISKMLMVLQNEKVDVVDAVKSHRGNESFLMRFLGKSFNRVLSYLSHFDMKGASDFKLMNSRVVDALLQMQEYARFFRGMSEWVGFRHGRVLFEVKDRLKGQSAWSFFSLLRLAFLAITSFSSGLLHVISLFGVIFALFSIVLGGQTLLMKLSGQAIDGFTTVILLLLIIGSALMLGLGVVGEYIGKIYAEVKQRPHYFISDSTSNIGTTSKKSTGKY